MILKKIIYLILLSHELVYSTHSQKSVLEKEISNCFFAVPQKRSKFDSCRFENHVITKCFFSAIRRRFFPEEGFGGLCHINRLAAVSESIPV